MTTEAEQDCKHGQLARSCNVCELESEVARQAAEIERLKSGCDLAVQQAETLVRLRDQDRDNANAMLRQALEEAAKRMEGPNNNHGAVIRALIGCKDD